jgi:hypothetical protein
LNGTALSDGADAMEVATHYGGLVSLALDVKVILISPCIFH